MDRSARYRGGHAGFVGRAAELRRLATWLGEARTGSCRLVDIVGSPGIGKSTLLGHFQSSCEEAGVRVFRGVCQEDLSIPYLPVATALRPLWKGDAAEVVELFDPPSAVQHAGDAADAQQSRLRLFLDAADLLVDAARDTPTVLAIDDLHWADDATLELLSHLVSTCLHGAGASNLPLMVVVAHRPATGPAERAIARLSREPFARSLVLAGLAEPEVNELLTLELPAAPSRQVLLSVLEATDGNPLFVRTLARHLLAGGQLAVRGHETVSTVGDELVVAWTDLGAALEARLAALSQPCHDLVELAAFLGDGAALADLVAVAGPSDGGVDALLDEAERAGVVLVDGEDRCWFGHPELRQRLYHAPAARRRRTIHARIAAGLEPGGRARAMEVAHHLRRAGPNVDLASLATYATWAGEQALAVFAWPKAARYFETALDATERLHEPTDDQLMALALGAARAHFNDHNLAACVQHARRAAGAAERLGDLDRRCSATLIEARARLTLDPTGAGSTGHGEALDRLLHDLGPDQPRLQARVYQLLAEESFARFDFVSGHAYAADAARLARAANDERLTSEVEFAAGLQHLGVLHLAEARETFHRHLTAADRADRWVADWGRGRLALLEWLGGDLRRAEAAAADALARTTVNRHWAEQSLVAAVAAGVAFAIGEFAAVEQHAADAVVLYHRSGYAYAPMIVYPVLACSRAMRGDEKGANEAIDDWERTGARATFRTRLAVSALLGDKADVEDRLRARPFAPTAAAPANLFTVGSIGSELEIGDLAGDASLVQAAAARLSEVAGEVLICMPNGGLVPRLLGLAQAHVRAPEAADTLRRAIELAESMGARPELARSHLDLGAVLLDGGDTSGAQEHLAAALDLADELGMLPTLRRAQILLASVPHATPPEIATRTLFLCDIQNSTPELFRSGDAGYIEMIRDMSRTVRARLRQYDGVEFKHTGDGIFAWFASAESAARCGLAVQADLAHRNELTDASPLILRIGLAAGQPVPEEGDFFGVSVVMASRLTDLAGGGQVLCSVDVVELARRGPFRFESLGRRSIKGMPGDHEVFAVSAHTG